MAKTRDDLEFLRGRNTWCGSGMLGFTQPVLGRRPELSVIQGSCPYSQQLLLLPQPGFAYSKEAGGGGRGLENEKVVTYNLSDFADLPARVTCLVIVGS